MKVVCNMSCLLRKDTSKANALWSDAVIVGHTTEKYPKANAKANAANVALTPPPRSGAFQPGTCAFVAAGANHSNEPRDIRPEVDGFVRHDGTRRNWMNYVGYLVLGTSGDLGSLT